MVPALTPNRPKTLATRRAGSRAIVAVSDPARADLIVRVLRRMGWCVATAGSAAEVRERLIEAPASVVILSPKLTDESGWLTCAKLTQPPAQSVVLIVGDDSPRNRMMARSVGAAALLADPVEIAEWVPPVRQPACN